MKHFEGAVNQMTLLLLSMIMIPEMIYLLFQQVYIATTLILFIYFILIYVVNNISYAITGDVLIVKTSFLYKQTYNISKIKSITKPSSKNAHSSFASQLLNVNCGKQGRIAIYPKDPQGLIEALLQIKSDIEIKTK